MFVRIETNMSQVIGGAINRMIDYARKQSQEDASRAAIPIVKARTKMGFDQDGNPFYSYRPRYAERRRKAGKQSNHVDLFWSGDMQRSLHYDKSKGGYTVDNDQVGKARGAQFADGPKNRSPRRWMGLRKADKEQVAKYIQAKMKPRILQQQSSEGNFHKSYKI